jgi:hypothetical protein
MQRAKLVTMTGDIGSMEASSVLDIGYGGEDGIPKLDTFVTYKFPIEFTSNCDVYAPKPVTYVERDRKASNFTTLEPTTVFVRFYQQSFAGKDPSWFLFTADTTTGQATEFVHWDNDTVNSVTTISALYAAGLSKITEIDSVTGSATGRTLLSWMIWDPYLDSAAAMEHILPQFDVALPNSASERAITVQLLTIYYDTIQPVAVEEKESFSSGIIISRAGGKVRIELPGVDHGTVMKIYALNGEPIREVRPSESVFEWDGTSSRKASVPRGIYLFQAGGFVGKIYYSPED